MDLSAKEDYSFGIGGRVRSKLSKIQIQFSKGHERYNFTIPVKVILDEYDFGVMLLGRKGFFDKFIIKFDELSEKVTLKRRYKQQ